MTHHVTLCFHLLLFVLLYLKITSLCTTPYGFFVTWRADKITRSIDNVWWTSIVTLYLYLSLKMQHMMTSFWNSNSCRRLRTFFQILYAFLKLGTFTSMCFTHLFSQGYLAQVLSFQYQLSVIAIDACSHHGSITNARAERIKKHYAAKLHKSRYGTQ